MIINEVGTVGHINSYKQNFFLIISIVLSKK